MRIREPKYSVTVLHFEVVQDKEGNDDWVVKEEETVCEDATIVQVMNEAAQFTEKNAGCHFVNDGGFFIRIETDDSLTELVVESSGY